MTEEENKEQDKEEDKDKYNSATIGSLTFTNKPAVVSGCLESSTHDYLYFQDEGKMSFRKMFRTLSDLMMADPNCVNDGSIMSDRCVIITPDHKFFHCVSFLVTVKIGVKVLKEGLMRWGY